MKFFTGVIAISSVWIVSAIADTSYQPPKTGPGPYPASGVPQSAANNPKAAAKPEAAPAKFTLLAAQQMAQTIGPRRVDYGTPTKPGYAVTEVEFGPAEPVTSPRPEPLAENVNEFGVNAVIPDSGIYYVLLPDGRLQKVSYTTMPLEETIGKLQSADNKVQSGYQANVRYQDVEPVRGPIYAYNPAPLVRIFK